MASTWREQTLLTRDSAVMTLNLTSSDTTVLGVTTVLTANQAVWRSILVGSSYSTLTTANSVAVKLDVDDKIGFLVGWVSTQLILATTERDVKLKVTAGTERGAWRRSLGAYTLNILEPEAAPSTDSALKKWMLGPFEGSRFAQFAASTTFGQKKGHAYVEFTITSATSASSATKAAILPFRWPDVDYDT